MELFFSDFSENKIVYRSFFKHMYIVGQIDKLFQFPNLLLSKSSALNNLY